MGFSTGVGDSPPAGAIAKRTGWGLSQCSLNDFEGPVNRCHFGTCRYCNVPENLQNFINT